MDPNTQYPQPSPTPPPEPTPSPLPPSDPNSNFAPAPPLPNQQQPFVASQPIAPQPPLMPQQPSKSNKGLLIGIGAGIAALVVIAIIAVVVVATMGVSKEDYRTAYNASSDLSSKLSKSSSTISGLTYFSSSNTETQITNDIDSAQKALSAYESANDDVRNLKAVNADGEAKKKWQTYQTKVEAYTKLAKSLVDSKSIYLAIVTCESINSSGVSDAQSFRTAVTPCQDALNNAKGSNEDLKKVADAYKTYITELISAVDSKNRSSIYDAQSKFRDVQKDARSNLNKAYDDNNPREDLYALNDYLYKKASAK